jgi:hypothetical protein
MAGLAQWESIRLKIVGSPVRSWEPAFFNPVIYLIIYLNKINMKDQLLYLGLPLRLMGFFFLPYMTYFIDQSFFSPNYTDFQ